MREDIRDAASDPATSEAPFYTQCNAQTRTFPICARLSITNAPALQADFGIILINRFFRHTSPFSRAVVLPSACMN